MGHVFQIMRGAGFWQLRVFLPKWTMRLSFERMNPSPGIIDGGWPSSE